MRKFDPEVTYEVWHYDAETGSHECLHRFGTDAAAARQTVNDGNDQHERGGMGDRFVYYAVEVTTRRVPVPGYVLLPGEVEKFDCCERAAEKSEAGEDVKDRDHEHDCENYDPTPAHTPAGP